MSEQRFTAAGGDLSQQMLLQMVYTRDVNQLSSPAELVLTLVEKNLLLQHIVTAQKPTLRLGEIHTLLGIGFNVN